MDSKVESLRRWVRQRWKSLLHFRESPHRLALAFGLGGFLGIVPGTGAIAAAVCATVLRLNLPVMVAGSLLTNPVTAPFVYIGSYLLGKWVLGERLPSGLVPRILLGTVTGNLILAVLLGVIGYFVVWSGVTFYRARTRAGSRSEISRFYR